MKMQNRITKLLILSTITLSGCCCDLYKIFAYDPGESYILDVCEMAKIGNIFSENTFKEIATSYKVDL